MFKQSALILGVSLSLALSACSKTETSPTEPVQKEQAEKPMPAKTEQKPDRERRTPPEAFYTACEGLEIGNACTIETKKGTRTGVCHVRKDETRALCRPDRPRPAAE